MATGDWPAPVPGPLLQVWEVGGWLYFAAVFFFNYLNSLHWKWARGGKRLSWLFSRGSLRASKEHQGPAGPKVLIGKTSVGLEGLLDPCLASAAFSCVT